LTLGHRVNSLVATPRAGVTVLYRQARLNEARTDADSIELRKVRTSAKTLGCLRSTSENPECTRWKSKSDRASTVAGCLQLCGFYTVGFAGALVEVGLPQHAIPVALLFFNLGRVDWAVGVRARGPNGERLVPHRNGASFSNLP
jgi:hypothetical protein